MHILPHKLYIMIDYYGRVHNMTITGQAYALGAGTIINAISTWKGAAFGIDLKTFSSVELSEENRGIQGSIREYPHGDTTLIERAVELVLEHFDMEMGGTVHTKSEIPLASGLKSSSAAANASILATLGAIGESLEPLEAIRIGVRAAREAGVTITGAFDDACASFMGGVVITDNRKDELVNHTPLEMDVLVFAPDTMALSSKTDVSRSELIGPWIDLAYDLALDGRYQEAMTLNGVMYCNALGYDTEMIMKGLECGVQGVSLSGTGPSFVALVDNEKAESLTDIWRNCGKGGKVIRTQINNKGAMRL